ncbi:hypothetical protein U3516DRAFT_760727 [Neocallimastix sp. 'constans']
MQLLKREPYPTISDRSIRKYSFNQYLIRCFALINQAKIVGDTVFINGFKNGFMKEELIYYLLEQQADVESRRNGNKLIFSDPMNTVILHYWDPFTIAAYYSKYDHKIVLISSQGDTLLMMACQDYDNIDIIKNGLIEIGVNGQIKNYEGDTALHEVCQCGSLETIKYLIKNLQTIVEYQDYSSSNPNANTNTNTNTNINTYANSNNTNSNVNSNANNTNSNANAIANNNNNNANAIANNNNNNTKVINANGNGNAIVNNNNNNNNFNLFSPSSSSFSKIPLSSSSGSYYLLEELNFFSSLSNMNCLIQYILLNYNLYDIYTFAKGAITYFSGFGYTVLISKGSLGTGETLREKKRTRKILRKNMYVRAPNAEYSVRLSNRDIICLCESIRKCCDYLNIPTTPKSVETKAVLSIKT